MDEQLIKALINRVQKQQIQIDKLVLIANKVTDKLESLKQRIQRLEDMHFGKVDDLMEGDLPF